jgi:hypothetical protein
VALPGPTPTATATAVLDRWWDDGAALLACPAGAYEDLLADPAGAHLVRETAWYAIGLLRRAGAGDHARAHRALGAVIDQQLDAPGTPWHGTYRKVAGWDPPVEGAVEWIDYDQNWRQFLGTTLAIAVTDWDLPSDLDGRTRASIATAVASEPPDRVPPTYANIALMRAWLEAWQAGADGDRDGAERAVELARAVVAAFDAHGCFLEHGSPTYYGVDLLALAMWRRPDSPTLLRAEGARIEHELWTDIARWWHGGLGTLCGPHSRAYGLDPHTHVSALALAIWAGAGREVAPLPDLDAPVVDHVHDLAVAPLLEHVGPLVPPEARAHLGGFQGRRSVAQVVGDDPHRVATGWLDEHLAVGAEDCAAGWSALDQYHPATCHWRRTDGTVGWLRARRGGPVRATAAEATLVLRCPPHRHRGPVPLDWELTGSVAGTATEWDLDGLAVEVETDGLVLGDRPASPIGPPAGADDFTVTLHLRPQG